MLREIGFYGSIITGTLLLIWLFVGLYYKQKLINTLKKNIELLQNQVKIDNMFIEHHRRYSEYYFSLLKAAGILKDDDEERKPPLNG